MTMAAVRRWHFYIGMFIAPGVLFFSLTGALQIFSLHESHGDYVAPAIIEELSSVHKDQTFAMGHHRPGPAGAQSGAPAGAPLGAHIAPDDDSRMAPPTLLLKWFFLLVALGLVASTCLGVWVGLTRPIGRRIGAALLLAGAIIPVFLLVI